MKGAHRLVLGETLYAATTTGPEPKIGGWIRHRKNGKEKPTPVRVSKRKEKKGTVKTLSPQKSDPPSS